MSGRRSSIGHPDISLDIRHLGTFKDFFLRTDLRTSKPGEGHLKTFIDFEKEHLRMPEGACSWIGKRAGQTGVNGVMAKVCGPHRTIPAPFTFVSLGFDHGDITVHVANGFEKLCVQCLNGFNFRHASKNANVIQEAAPRQIFDPDVAFSLSSDCRLLYLMYCLNLRFDKSRVPSSELSDRLELQVNSKQEYTGDIRRGKGFKFTERTETIQSRIGCSRNLPNDDSTAVLLNSPQEFPSQSAETRNLFKGDLGAGGDTDNIVPRPEEDAACENWDVDSYSWERNNSHLFSMGSDEDEDSSSSSDESFADAETLDKFLFVWHSSIMMTCMFLLVVGVILRFYFSTIVLNSVKSLDSYEIYSRFVRIESAPSMFVFGDLVPMLGNSLIVLNATYIVCTILYMSFKIHRNIFTLPLVSLVSGGVTLVEVNIIHIYMAPVSAANEEAKKALLDKITRVYAIDDSTVFSLTYDIISIWGHCCGIVDQYDFQTLVLKYIESAKESKIFQVPPTCCNEAAFRINSEAVVDCASKGEGIYPEGCYIMLYNWLRYYANLYSGIVVIQLLDICIHLVLYKRVIRLYKLANDEH